MPTVLQRMAERARSVEDGLLPAEVIRAAAARLLDAFGCMVGGAAGAAVQATYAAVGASTGEASLVADTRRAAAAEAALANCAALRHLDYMDGHSGPYSCHPCLVIPALLAVSEARGRSGADLVRAIVVGYEFHIRLQLACGDPDITAHGFTGSTNLGIAVPMGLGALLGLPPGVLADAMAISTVHAPTLDATGRGQHAESKSCVDGLVALSAVIACQLAERGVRGQPSAFEGDGGFVATVGRAFDEEILTGPIERFRILDVYTKYYNAVKCAQSAAGAAVALRGEIADLDDIESVVLRLPERDCRHQSKDDQVRRRPINRDTANHSAIYCLAVALVTGRLEADQFSAEARSDPRVLQVVDRVTIESTPELTALWPQANPAEVEIATRSGRRFVNRVTHSLGHPQNPMSDEDLERKFRSLAGPVLGPSAVAALAQRIWEVADLPDLNELMALAAAGNPRPPPGRGSTETS